MKNIQKLILPLLGAILFCAACKTQKQTTPKTCAQLAMDTLRGTAEIKPGATGAFKILYPCAQNGDAEAQFHTGNFYLNGTGIKQDHKKAIFGYQKACQTALAQENPQLALQAKTMLQKIENN